MKPKTYSEILKEMAHAEFDNGMGGGSGAGTGWGIRVLAMTTGRTYDRVLADMKKTEEYYRGEFYNGEATKEPLVLD